MKHAYHERPEQPICAPDKIARTEPRLWKGGPGLYPFCWRQTSEAQMWEEVRCHKCGKRAHWVGLASPFGDGQQYFSGGDAWCYWCFPRHHLTQEQQRLARHAEWARHKPWMSAWKSFTAQRGERDGRFDAGASCTRDRVTHVPQP